MSSLISIKNGYFNIGVGCAFVLFSAILIKIKSLSNNNSQSSDRSNSNSNSDSNSNIPFQTTDWENIPTIQYKGETGIAYWKTVDYKGLRLRMVEYSKNYKSDHYCEKGHIIYCIEGEMNTQLNDGRIIKLTKGMTYQVSDKLSSHCTSSINGVKLFIIDGDFLK